jgi:hypothetical protein
MKLLVLGNSDTSAAFSGGRSWAELVREGLERELSEPIEYEHLVFGPFGRQSPALAEELVRDSEADVVILPLGDFAFTTGFVWKRVESLFGRRAGRSYRRREQQFDAATRGGRRMRTALNGLARRWARRLVGTQPLMSVEQASSCYEAVVRAIARVEQAHVVLVGYPTAGPPHEKPRLDRERERFHARVREVAARHRYQWVAANDAVAHLPSATDVFTPDGFHMNQLGHQLLGAHVLREIVAATAAARA